MTRRDVLARIAQGIGLVVAGVVGIPAALYALSPAVKRQQGPVWRPIGSLDDFPVGEVREALVEVPAFTWSGEPKLQGVYVWRPEPDELVVFSRACTDLGCPVNWDRGSQTYFCPCHGGIFAKDGERMAGPPKRPLYRYARRITGGRVEIDLLSVPPQA